MPNLEDVQGIPCSCEDSKWITVGEIEHNGKTYPLQEPCPVCLPRLNLGEDNEDS